MHRVHFRPYSILWMIILKNICYAYRHWNLQYSYYVLIQKQSGNFEDANHITAATANNHPIPRTVHTTHLFHRMLWVFALYVLLGVYVCMYVVMVESVVAIAARWTTTATPKIYLYLRPALSLSLGNDLAAQWFPTLCGKYSTSLDGIFHPILRTWKTRFKI